MTNGLLPALQCNFHCKGAGLYVWSLLVGSYVTFVSTQILWTMDLLVHCDGCYAGCGVLHCEIQGMSN